MNFLKKIGSSVYDPAFYQELLHKPFQYSLKYFFGLITVISLIYTVGFSILVVPVVSSFFETVKTGVATHYPEGLEVTIKNGMASTNATEPYFVKFPKDGTESASAPENFLVIDTKHDFSLDRFNEQKTFVLLTQDTVVYKDKDDKITMQPLSKVPETHITRDTVNKFLDDAEPYLNIFPYVIPVLALIVIYIANIFLLVYFLIVALLVWLVAKIIKLQIGYKKAYQITIHAFTLLLIAKLVLEFFHLNLPTFVPTAILLLVVLLNLKNSTSVGNVAQI